MLPRGDNTARCGSSRLFEAQGGCEFCSPSVTRKKSKGTATLHRDFRSLRSTNGRRPDRIVVTSLRPMHDRRSSHLRNVWIPMKFRHCVSVVANSRLVSQHRYPTPASRFTSHALGRNDAVSRLVRLVNLRLPGTPLGPFRVSSPQCKDVAPPAREPDMKDKPSIVLVIDSSCKAPPLPCPEPG
jgi:hypothetical protein